MVKDFTKFGQTLEKNLKEHIDQEYASDEIKRTEEVLVAKCMDNLNQGYDNVSHILKSTGKDMPKYADELN